MGEEYTYICKGCGKDVQLVMGPYNCKGWGDKQSVSEILDGRYGKKAKEVYESHPHRNFHFQADIFQCGCGYIKSYDSLVIHEDVVIDPEIFFFQEHRCPRCRKPMERLPDFPFDATCPKCGDRMVMDPKSRFRW